jgi:hypothetical protein
MEVQRDGKEQAMDPMTRYDLVKMHQRELRLEAEERRHSREVQSSHQLRARAWIGKLLIATGKVLGGVSELPPVQDRYAGESR